MDVIRINPILNSYTGCMNENLLCLNDIDTYRKSIIMMNSRNMMI